MQQCRTRALHNTVFTQLTHAFPGSCVSVNRHARLTAYCGIANISFLGVTGHAEAHSYANLWYLSRATSN